MLSIVTNLVVRHWKKNTQKKREEMNGEVGQWINNRLTVIWSSVGVQRPTWHFYGISPYILRDFRHFFSIVSSFLFINLECQKLEAPLHFCSLCLACGMEIFIFTWPRSTFSFAYRWRCFRFIIWGAKTVYLYLLEQHSLSWWIYDWGLYYKWNKLSETNI